MRILFDPPKRLTNRDAHEGLDFADLDLDFFMRSVVVPAKAGRSLAIGSFRDTVIAVVFVPLGREAISVISMRRATRKERSLL